MILRLVAAAAFGATLSSVAPAQSPAPVQAPRLEGTTPTECLKGANDWRTRAIAAAPIARRDGDLFAATLTEARRAAKECAAQFSIDTMPAGSIASLINLYAFIGDTARARIAVKHELAAKNLSPRERGAALNQAINLEIAAATGYFGILEGAERYATEIDALPDSLAEFKISAHLTLLNRYDYLDVDPGLQKHALALLRLGRQTGKKAGMATAFMGLARASADMLQPDAALKTLDDAEKEIGANPEFKDFRDRYALIGTKAAPVTGQWWVNAGESTAPVQPGDGKVTLIEFTAHWCAPCRNSYPGLREIAQHFQGKPFQGVMATDLYGFIGERKNLTPEQEVAADREYFGKEYALPFKVAINPLTNPSAPSLNRAYRVGGIPQLMLVDKHGIIRQIVTGWDRGNTARFTAFIDRLIAEP